LLTIILNTVKQEIARMGIIPVSEFWASSTRRGTPGPALLLHFLATSIFVLAAPLDDPSGFLVISTLFVYARTWLSSKYIPMCNAGGRVSASLTPCSCSRPRSSCRAIPYVFCEGQRALDLLLLFWWSSIISLGTSPSYSAIRSRQCFDNGPVLVSTRQEEHSHEDTGNLAVLFWADHWYCVLCCRPHILDLGLTFVTISGVPYGSLPRETRRSYCVHVISGE
jgi:hypothetical protein